MNNSRNSILSGIAGILMILIAVRSALSSLDGTLLVVGVILVAVGVTIADRDRELKRVVEQEERMRELRNAINPAIDDDDDRS